MAGKGPSEGGDGDRKQLFEADCSSAQPGQPLREGAVQVSS